MVRGVIMQNDDKFRSGVSLKDDSFKPELLQSGAIPKNERIGKHYAKEA